MLKTPLGGCRGTGSRAASTTGYGAFGGLHSPAGAVAESTVETTMRTAGTFSGFWVNITSNNRGASTFNFRKNQANGNQTISIGASATGFFQDTSNSDTVAAGDEICYQWNTGAGGSTFIDKTIGVYFEASSGLVAPLIAFEGVNLSTVTTHFVPLSGNPVDSQTEADAEQTFTATGTLKNLCVNISGNARTTTSTVNSRKNGANGNMSISISASSTGLFEDTTNSDTIAANDTACVGVTLGTGTGNLGIRTFKVEFESSNALTHVLGRGSPTSLNANTTSYFIPTSPKNQSTTETDARFPFPEAGARISNLRVRVASNGITATSTVTVRKNAAGTTLTVSISSGATGAFEDTTNDEVTAAAHELWCIEVVTGATGTTLGYSGHNILLGPPQSVSTTVATAKATSVNSTVTLGNLTVNPAVAVSRAYATNASITLGGITVPVTAAVARAYALDVSTSVGGTLVNLTEAIANARANGVTITLGGVIASMVAAVANARSSSFTITPGGITVPVTAAVARGYANAIATGGGVVVSLTPAIARSYAETINIIAGGVQAALTAAVARGYTAAITITAGGITVPVSPAVARAVAMGVTADAVGAAVNQLRATLLSNHALRVRVLSGHALRVTLHTHHN